MMEFLKMVGSSLLAGIIIGTIFFGCTILVRIADKHFFVFSCIVFFIIARLDANIALTFIMKAISVVVAICGVIIVFLTINWIEEKWSDL